MLPAWSRTRSNSTPGSPGRSAACLLEQERAVVSTTLECAFGLHCLQVGAWGTADTFLGAARTRRTALVAARPVPGAALVAEPAALALQSDSVDVMLLPHTLEFAPDPHEVLREAARVLAGEGELVVLGFEPLGSWSLRNAFTPRRLPAGNRAHDPGHATCGLAEAGRLRSRPARSATCMRRRFPACARRGRADSSSAWDAVPGRVSPAPTCCTRASACIR